jgi:hypothetical protein
MLTITATPATAHVTSCDKVIGKEFEITKQANNAEKPLNPKSIPPTAR